MQQKTVTLFGSYAVLLVVSSALAFMSRPTEMGLAIVAGALGLAFSNIDKLSRFKGAGFEAEMRMVEALLESQTEPSSEQKEEARKVDRISDLEGKILSSLRRPGYTWRYSSTVAGEISETASVVESTLLSLMERDLVTKAKGSNGEIWATTNLGNSVHEEYVRRLTFDKSGA